MIATKANVCEPEKMDKFLENKLEGMDLRHFLNHVAKCDRCLLFILKEKGIR